MNLIGKILLLITSFCFLSCQPGLNPDADERDWISLFNGINLDGWTPKFRGYPAGENYLNTFRVHNGVLQANYSDYEQFDERFGHLFYKDTFSHYHLMVEYRTVGDSVVPGAPGWAYRNNGLMLHGQWPGDMGLDQDFPISLEVQLLSGNGTDERPTANLCTPGTHVHFGDSLITQHCIPSNSKTYHGDIWVRVEAIVLGDSILHHLVEGDTVMSYRKPVMGSGVVNGHFPEALSEGKPLKSGTISVQAESHHTEFRKIELLNLCGCTDKKAKNYKTYFIKTDNSKCLY